jgi:hypothetical protein
MAPQVLEHPGARPTRRSLMDTTESSAPHAHPSTEDHDDTVEAHYSGLDHLRPCACMNGTVFIGHLVVGEDGDEVERIEAVPCCKCSNEA